MGIKTLALFSIVVLASLLITQGAGIASADQDDKEPEVEKRIHVLYNTSPTKPSGTPGNGKPDKPSDEGTYETFGKGIIWKDTPIDFVIDADNSQLTASFVQSAIWAGATEWDDYTSTTLFGSYSASTTATWDDTTRDGKNEMVFEDYSNSNVIAITITWGYFGGPPNSREILEFDILFNTDFIWGDATSDSSVMDLQNIATHEIGHGLGLADLYNSADSLETMYGYASNGETQKRNLYDGDIAGIQSLYGN